MKHLLSSLVIILAISSASLSVIPVHAQDHGAPSPSTITQDDDGNIYHWVDGGYYRVTPGRMAPETLATYPDLGFVGPTGPNDEGFGPQARLNTANGPRTELQIKNELRYADYNGPWDLGSMIAAYTKATSPSAPPPALVPAPVPPQVPPAIAVSDAWVEGKLRLIANEPQERNTNCFNNCHDLRSYFRVENRTGSTLNFEVDKSVFLLTLSTGKQYRANNVDDRTSLIVNNLTDGGGQDFSVIWSVRDWDTWQADLRTSDVSYYEMSATEFTSRIHNARWHKDITH